MLIELLGNALKYTTTGEVKLSVILAQPRSVNSDRVVLSFHISDTSGAETLTAQRRNDLALAYCQQLLNLLGARLLMESSKFGVTYSFQVNRQTNKQKKKIINKINYNSNRTTNVLSSISNSFSFFCRFHYKSIVAQIITQTL